MLLLLLPAALALPSPAELSALPPGLLDRHPRGSRSPTFASATATGDWDIEHYEIELLVDPDARVVSGTVTLTAQAVGAAPETLVLHADGPDLLSVRVDGSPVDWEEDGDEVQIPTAHAGDSLTVIVQYTVSGDDANGVYLGLNWGDPINSFHEPEGARHWLVVRDVPHDKATLTWRMTMPDDWVVVQNGVVTSSTTTDGWTTTVSELDQPLPPYLMVLHAGDFQVWRDDSGDVPVELWAEPDRLDEVIADLGDTADIIDLFSQLWDPYPWPLYRNVVLPFGGGMEHTTATTFGDELIGTSSAGLINAHEIAHHWWGDYLTCASWDEIWLNEGFASHAELRFYEDAYGAEGRQAYFEHQRESYIEWKGYEGIFSLYDPNYMWGGTVYDKGSLVLDMLRSLVGDDRFDAALRRYAEDNAHGAVTTADLQAAVETETGESWGWYFDQWVYQADDPTYVVGVRQTLLTDGSWQIDLLARQDNDAGRWSMPLEWALTLVDGTTLRESFWVDEDLSSVSICVAAAADEVQLDPDSRLLHDGIERDDGSFEAMAITCGTPSDEQPSGDDSGGPSTPEGTAYPLGCGGCASAGSAAAGVLWLGLGALLGLRRRAR